MLLAILAAGSVAAAPAPTEISPLDVTAGKPVVKQTLDVSGDDNWTYRPSAALILMVWPKAAYEDHIDGHAVLACKVDVHGLAEDCRIASETPANKGFGKAALMLRPTFKVKPAMGPDGPVESMMNIAIKFDGGDDGVEMTLHGTTMDSTETRINSTRAEMREITLLDHPVWARAATFEQLARGYPVNGRGVEGFAVAHCRVERSGALNRCEPRKEVPDKHGFGVAAAELAHRFVVEIDPDQIPRGPPLWVDIPMRFPAPGATDERVVTSPTWLRGLDPGRSAKIFPPEAVAQGVASGRGLVRCVVAANGALTDCTALPGEPEGLGFSEAAVKVASTLRMNPWTADGAPVDGAVIRLPIRFNLKATK